MDFTDLILEEKEFEKIRSIVYKTSGIILADSKKALVVSRLTRRLQQLNIPTFQNYVSYLEANPNEINLLINRITTNHTKFYREKHQFDVLRDKIFPILWAEKEKKRERSLRIWSAGCSTGEEVYTILFEVLHAQFTLNKIRYSISNDIKILGSDIDTTVLKKAESGQYTEEEIKGLDTPLLEKYFDKTDQEHYQIKKEIKKLVVFKRINLVHDSFHFKHKIDIIFCRNVVIYFDMDTRKEVYNKFNRVMNDPSYFFSGHSENLFQHKHLFKFVEKSIYKKVV